VANSANAFIIVGCLVTYLVSLIYKVDFPVWVLWLIGVFAVVDEVIEKGLQMGKLNIELEKLQGRKR